MIDKEINRETDRRIDGLREVKIDENIEAKMKK